MQTDAVPLVPRLHLMRVERTPHFHFSFSQLEAEWVRTSTKWVTSQLYEPNPWLA